MRKTIALLIVIVAASLAPGARAGFYAGASFVQTDSEFKTAVDNFKADDSSYKIYAGTTFLKFLGLEATYRDLGSHEDTIADSKLNVDLEAFDICARGILPVGKRVSLFARVGYANISTKGSLDISDEIQNFDESDWELMYGVGIDVRFLRFFGLRAEWETYDVDEDLNSFSAGAFVRF